MKLSHLLFSFWMIYCLSGMAHAGHKLHPKRARHYTHISAPLAMPVLSGSRQLANELSYLINASNLHADIAVNVKSMKYGDSLYTHNIHQPLTPASTLKILTAEAALIYLGPNYRFSTQLLTDAKGIKNGVLKGNLYVVLSGDPTLTYYDLVDLLESLRSEQIRAIAGNVYIDNTAYDQSFYGPGWMWQDKSYCYAAPISASIINHNCFKYAAPTIRNSGTLPKNRRTRTLALSSRSDNILSIDNYSTKGHYALGVSYVVTDIPEYNRTLFKRVLNQLSISVYGSVTFGSAPDTLSLVSSHNSKLLTMLINEMLKKSDNVIAGALFKKLGQLYSRQPGSWENGSLAVSQILSKRAGVNITGMRILDGSGLSSSNLTTSSQLMQVLDFAFHHPSIKDTFISSLPIAGVDGTLKHRMGNISRKIRAKTGTISGVASLAGYAESRDKEPLAFVIMINGSKGYGWRYKTLEDKIATALTRYKRS
jgi:D-alanyl-D-alanine carboxypeptidase/D-alanyl-D-alanine-endopeptidase (penicillin-binding protein 4)